MELLQNLMSMSYIHHHLIQHRRHQMRYNQLYNLSMSISFHSMNRCYKLQMRMHMVPLEHLMHTKYMNHRVRSYHSHLYQRMKHTCSQNRYCKQFLTMNHHYKS